MDQSPPPDSRPHKHIDSTHQQAQSGRSVGNAQVSGHRFCASYGSALRLRLWFPNLGTDREHQGLGLCRHGRDLNTKGCGDAFIPYDVSIGIGCKFRAAQMVTMQEGETAA